MYQLDRWAAIIKPRQPFLNWLNGLPGSLPPALGLEQMRSGCTTLLIPEFDDPDEAVAFVYRLWRDLFESELSAWCPDRKLWPSGHSVEKFMEWFDVEIHSPVIEVEPELGKEEDLPALPSAPE